MREAAGYILFTREGGERRFLLLRNARHGTWSFPKGHLKRGEGRRDGALRELREETGINAIRDVPGFEAILRYRVPAGRRPSDPAGYDKTLFLFLAETATAEWTRSKEHDDGGWYPAEAALARIRHADLRGAFQDALAFLDREPD